jgi:LemA protein
VLGIWLIIAAVAIFAIYVIYVFNKLVRTKNRVNNAWSQIDVQLRRRYDLIPNLVETVKGYAAHEREVFEEVTQARASGEQAQTVQDQASAENQITSGLRRLIAVAENYPELKANQNFLDLQAQLKDTEDKIAISRQVYNDTVLTFNNGIQTFPAVVLAGALGFSKREFFEIDEGDSAAPAVSFAADAARAAPVASPPSDAPSA